MLRIVVANYKFLLANVEFLGSVPNASTFQASHLYSYIIRGNPSLDIKKFELYRMIKRYN